VRVDGSGDRVAAPPRQRPERSQDARAEAAGDLLGGVLGARARTDRLQRLAALEHGAAAAAGSDRGPPADLGAAAGALVDKVARHAYRVSEEDVAAARQAGWSEHELFELIVATATGAGLARRELGRSAAARWEERG
jgi:HD-GYP domain-containing protein (c-di-GMP phosphodiesterase class II)